MTGTAALTEEPVLLGTEPPRITRDRRVQAYVAAAAVSAFGDAAFAVALAWTAVHLLSPAAAGLVVAIETLPQAVLTLIGGGLADRLDTRRLMVAGLVAQAVVFGLAAGLWSAGLQDAALLFGVALVFGATVGLSAPAGATLARQLVRADDLGTVSGWRQVGSRVARLLGAPAGAGLVAGGGLGGVMALDAVTFAVVAVVVVGVVRLRYRLPRAAGESFRATLAGGLRHVARARVARTLVVGLCGLNVFVTPVLGVGVALRVTDSGWSATWVGIAEACFAAGAITGSLLGMRRTPRRPALAGFGVLVLQGVGLALIGLPMRTSLLTAMLLVGLTAGLASVLLSATFQRVISPAHLGRVSSVAQLGDLALLPAATPLFGALAAATSIGVAALGFGIAMSLLCAICASRPEIRSLC